MRGFEFRVIGSRVQGFVGVLGLGLSGDSF